MAGSESASPDGGLTGLIGIASDSGRGAVEIRRVAPFVRYRSASA
jgi:hypothetical protein